MWLTGLGPVPSPGMLGERVDVSTPKTAVGWPPPRPPPPDFASAFITISRTWHREGFSSETVLRDVFQTLAPNRLPKHGFQNIDGKDPPVQLPGKNALRIL